VRLYGRGREDSGFVFEKPALSPSKGEATKKIWFTNWNLERNLGKTNPLNENDLADFVKLPKVQSGFGEFVDGQYGGLCLVRATRESPLRTTFR